MNIAVYESARRAGCTRAEAELLSYYIELSSLKAAAEAAGMSYGSARNNSVRIKRRLGVDHLSAAIRKVTTQ